MMACLSKATRFFACLTFTLGRSTGAVGLLRKSPPIRPTLLAKVCRWISRRGSATALLSSTEQLRPQRSVSAEFIASFGKNEISSVMATASSPDYKLATNESALQERDVQAVPQQERYGRQLGASQEFSKWLADVRERKRAAEREAGDEAQKSKLDALADTNESDEFSLQHASSSSPRDVSTSENVAPEHPTSTGLTAANPQEDAEASTKDNDELPCTEKSKAQADALRRRYMHKFCASAGRGAPPPKPSFEEKRLASERGEGSSLRPKSDQTQSDQAARLAQEILQDQMTGCTEGQKEALKEQKRAYWREFSRRTEETWKNEARPQDTKRRRTGTSKRAHFSATTADGEPILDIDIDSRRSHNREKKMEKEEEEAKRRQV